MVSIVPYGGGGAFFRGSKALCLVVQALIRTHGGAYKRQKNANFVHHIRSKRFFNICTPRFERMNGPSFVLRVPSESKLLHTRFPGPAPWVLEVNFQRGIVRNQDLHESGEFISHVLLAASWRHLCNLPIFRKRNPWNFELGKTLWSLSCDCCKKSGLAPRIRSLS